jgi:hypothetical protein
VTPTVVRRVGVPFNIRLDELGAADRHQQVLLCSTLLQTDV